MNLKRYLALLSLVLVIINVLGLATSAAFVRSSPVLNMTRVDLAANGSNIMHAQVTVIARGTYDEVGITELYIEKKVGSVWREHATWTLDDHPEFMWEDTAAYLEDFYFDGSIGTTYRVTAYSYARNGSVSGTGEYTSAEVTCR